MERYIPTFTVTIPMMKQVAEIAEKIGKISNYHSFETKPHLRRNNRIRSVWSSVAIEANSLSLDEVRGVINGKTVIGPEKDIREVKNAYQAYELLGSFDPFSLEDLKRLHGIMTYLTVQQTDQPEPELYQEIRRRPAMRELFQMDRQDYNPEGKVYERPSARAIILKDGKVLLNHLGIHDCYEFPGGGIEPGETPESALRREVAEETGRIVIPESIREFGIVIRRQRDSKDPDGIFEQRNYYYFCEVTDEEVPRKPDEHEILDGAEPVWVDSLATPMYRNRKAFERIGEPFMQREMRVMDMADGELRKRSWERTEEAAIRSLGSADYSGMLSFVRQTLEDVRTEGEKQIGMHKMEFGYTRYEHTKRVLGWAKRLYDATADKAGLRYEDLMIATIFHDIGRAVSARSGGDHAKEGVPLTRDWLLSNGYDPDRAEYIAGLVGSHSEKWRMRDPAVDRNLLMLMEADLLDDMGLLGIVMDTMIVRARKAEATFYDCYNHYERYTHPMQYDCPVVTPEAKAFWNEKTESTERFVEQYRKDILFGAENYIGYR